MRIIVIGGNGTLGSAIVKEMSPRHEVLSVSSSRGTVKCDISSESSIRNLFENVGEFHAVAIAAGNVHFEEFAKMTSEKYHIGLNHKLMGQVNVVRIGSEFIQNNGSFTLISGILSRDPVRAGSSASMVNSAIDGFVRAAAIELPRGIRINSVSPSVFVESLDKYGEYFPGFVPVSAAQAAFAFRKSIEGHQTGQIYHIG